MATASAFQNCPRCLTGQIQPQFRAEPRCIHCGFVDYAAPAPEQSRKRQPYTIIIRYGGRFAEQRNNVVAAAVVHRPGSTNPDLIPTCPFCRAKMAISSLSGKRRRKTEVRYKCPSGHRISVLPTKGGWHWE